jgi:hypothetical protein
LEEKRERMNETSEKVFLAAAVVTAGDNGGRRKYAK